MWLKKSRTFKFLAILGLVIFLEGCSQTPLKISSEVSFLFPRATWVWDTPSGEVDKILTTNSAEQQAFFSFCQSRGIGRVFIYLNATTPIGLYQTNQLINFITLAHNFEIKVYALGAGSNLWVLTSYHHYAESFLSNILDYNGRVTPAAKFDGVHFDLEPHALTSANGYTGAYVWNETDNSPLLTQYLALFQSLKSIVANSGQTLTLGADFPYWYSDNVAKVKVNSQPVSYYLLNLLDLAVILTYSDTATGDLGIVTLSQNSLNFADILNKKVMIGVETQNLVGLGLGTAPETFYEEGTDFLHTELTTVETSLVTHSSFSGIAIHYYTSYKDLK